MHIPKRWGHGPMLLQELIRNVSIRGSIGMKMRLWQRKTREYFTEYIEKYGDQGACIFVIEYVDDNPVNATLKKEIKKYCKEHNYLLYISDSINLD